VAFECNHSMTELLVISSTLWLAILSGAAAARDRVLLSGGNRKPSAITTTAIAAVNQMA
jgi:hypothetical protein